MSDLPRCNVIQTYRLLFGLLVEELKHPDFVSAQVFSIMCLSVAYSVLLTVKGKVTEYFHCCICPSLHKKISNADTRFC